MDFRSAGEPDLPAIRQLLRSANDTPWNLERAAREKCFEPGPLGPPETIVAEESGVLLGVSVSTSRALRLLAVHPERRREGIGSELLSHSLQRAPGRFVVYGEAGNYFLPGVPENDPGTLSFFRSRGFSEEAEAAVNLVIPLHGNPKIPDAPPVGVERGSEAERNAIAGFVAAKFGPAWAWEVSRAIENDPPTLFIVRGDDGRLAGFAAHEANNRGLGFFGPMGVDPSGRGRGSGRSLLLASLSDLKRLGYREAVISWAANHQFYQRVAGVGRELRMIRFWTVR